MVILAYIISIIIFYIAELIFSALTLAVYGFILYLCSLITKQTIQMFSYSTQFIGSFLGTLIGITIAIYSFCWFNIIPKYYIAIPIFGIFSLWLKPNELIKPEMQPKAQRIGVVLATLTILTYYLIIDYK